MAEVEKVRTSAEDLRARRLRAQRISDPVATVAEAARLACGLQAQDESAAALAVRARTEGLVRADVIAALDRGEVVRTWAMRGTLHLLAADDARWMVPLFGPTFSSKAKRRQAQLGLDGPTLERAVDRIREAGECERAELFAKLGLEGQARIHAVAEAARRGHVVFAAGDRIVPFAAEAIDREEGLRRLAKRYASAFGPATADDFAAWSGLPAREARSAWSDGQPPPAGPVPAARLLGAYDNVLLGWRDRTWLVPPQFASRVHPGGGRLHAVLLVDGEAVATWGAARRGKRVEVAIEPFGAMPPGVEAAVDREIADVGRFLS